MLQIAVRMEQVAAHIELRGEAVCLHGHIAHADMGHHVEHIGLDHVLGLHPGGDHAGIDVALDAPAKTQRGRDVLLQLVLGGGIAEIGDHVDVVHAPAPVERHTPEVEVVLGAVEVAARLGVACAHVEGEADPALARASVKCPVAADHAAREVGVIPRIEAARAEITRTV